jgi:hypothetical protein
MAMTHLFDRLLIATYDRLSGISRAELVLQVRRRGGGDRGAS